MPPPRPSFFFLYYNPYRLAECWEFRIRFQLQAVPERALPVGVALGLLVAHATALLADLRRSNGAPSLSLRRFAWLRLTLRWLRLAREELRGRARRALGRSMALLAAGPARVERLRHLGQSAIGRPVSQLVAVVAGRGLAPLALAAAFSPAIAPAGPLP